MNHSGKIRRNHEFPSLKLRNHELREVVKRIMNNEMSFPTIFETGDYRVLTVHPHFIKLARI